MFYLFSITSQIPEALFFFFNFSPSVLLQDLGLIRATWPLPKVEAWLCFLKEILICACLTFLHLQMRSGAGTLEHGETRFMAHQERILEGWLGFPPHS